MSKSWPQVQLQYILAEHFWPLRSEIPWLICQLMFSIRCQTTRSCVMSHSTIRRRISCEEFWRFLLLSSKHNCEIVISDQKPYDSYIWTIDSFKWKCTFYWYFISIVKISIDSKHKIIFKTSYTIINYMLSNSKLKKRIIIYAHIVMNENLNMKCILYLL